MKLAFFTGEKGASLVEVVCAVAILAIVLAMFVSAMSTATLGIGLVRQRVTAANIARSQLEYVKEVPFLDGADSYTPTVASPIGYTATISATTVYTGIQLITVTVSYQGEPVFTVHECKVKR